MHPEVVLGLLTLLYAGTTLNFKYLKVTKLKLLSKSAGNNNIIGTSETLRNEITEIIKPISEHVPKHLRPVNDNQLGHYLAGLIDSNGHFNNKQELIIIFNLLDASLAYFLKKQIGYGKINKNNNNIHLIINTNKGLERVINLINGKIRTNNILKSDYFIKYNNITLNLDNNFNNHWFAGFSDANSSFQINENNIEIQLNYQINHKEKNILIIIKNIFGGNISYIEFNNIYYYNSTSFGSARKLIKYFNNFHLSSTKYINYIKWRKAYLIIQNNKHFTQSGLDKIIKWKKTMNKNNHTIIF